MKSARSGEGVLVRLEELRDALISLHGNNWTAKRPQQIWIPASEAEWRSLAERSNEDGIHISGQRTDWIVVNPKTQDLRQVVSHEYIHAVLNNALPNISAWFAEGLCEYYSTLDVNDPDNSRFIVAGRPLPGRHSALSDGWKLEDLDLKQLDAQQYALAWTIVHRLAALPGWEAFLRQPLSGSNFWTLTTSQLGIQASDLRDFLKRAGPSYAVRNTGRRAGKWETAYVALSPAEVAELEADYNARLPSRRVLSQEAKAADGAQQIFLNGLKLADEGKLDEAAILMEQACRLKPSNSSWWHALALAYRDLGDQDNARTAAARAVATAVNRTEAEAAKVLAAAL